MTLFSVFTATATKARSPGLQHTLAAGVLTMMMAACVSRAPAPVEDRGMSRRPLSPLATPTPEVPAPPQLETRPQTYTVKRGDTLYAIALDNGLDYRDLAAWNSIENVNRILVGQVLRLSSPGDGADGAASASGVVTSPLKPAPPVVAGEGTPPPVAQAPVARNTGNYKSQPKALKEPYSEHAMREMQRQGGAPSIAMASPQPEAAPPANPPVAPAPRVESKPEPPADTRAAPTDEDSKIQWLWPTEGKVITAFSDTENLKGIDIAGKTGQPVFAAAAGKVVYAGTGLRGYGKLIIVKHNNSFLSAYAHNKDILVKEGQQVTRGQKIAEMGNTDSDQVKLHFEIRRMGKPIDPLKYLPPA